MVITHDEAAQIDRLECPTLIVIRMGLLQLSSKSGEFDVGLFQCDTPFEPAENRPVTRTTIEQVVRADTHGTPELRNLRGILERSRHDTDDGVGDIVEHDLSADDRVTGVELAEPKRMTEHHDRGSPGFEIISVPCPAPQRSNPEEFEIVRRDFGTVQKRGGIGAREIDVVVILGGKRAERGVA